MTHKEATLPSPSFHPLMRPSLALHSDLIDGASHRLTASPQQSLYCHLHLLQAHSLSQLQCFCACNKGVWVSQPSQLPSCKLQAPEDKTVTTQTEAKDSAEAEDTNAQA